MLLARVQGHATSTVKHPSLQGAKMILVQPIRSLTKEPLLVFDRMGAGAGDLVLLTSDGQGAREMVGDDTSPIRWTVLGLIEHVDGLPE